MFPNAMAINRWLCNPSSCGSTAFSVRTETNEGITMMNTNFHSPPPCPSWDYPVSGTCDCRLGGASLVKTDTARGLRRLSPSLLIAGFAATVSSRVIRRMSHICLLCLKSGVSRLMSLMSRLLYMQQLHGWLCINSLVKNDPSDFSRLMSLMSHVSCLMSLMSHVFIIVQ